MKLEDNIQTDSLWVILGIFSLMAFVFAYQADAFLTSFVLLVFFGINVMKIISQKYPEHILSKFINQI